MTITRLTPNDVGCYVDSWWGQYSIAHTIDRAREFGYVNDELTSLAARKLSRMGPLTAPEWRAELSEEEEERLSDSDDEVVTWLNDHVAPPGHSFQWDSDGMGLYMWADDDHE